MEGLPFDFGFEHDSEDEDRFEKREKAKATTLLESIRKKRESGERKGVSPLETESIGRMLINAESPSQRARGELAGISAYTMDREQLLRLASTIKVEGGDLKHIYLTHNIGEMGLRRVLAEYLSSGNYAKALRNELAEREKDFERDPLLRDQASSQPVDSSNAQLESLLHKSGIDWSESEDLPKSTKNKRRNNKHIPAFINDIKTASPIRRIADILMVGAILAMATIITVLIFTR